MNISVILCTYNRPQRLKAALESLVASQMPESVEWEILVVDNNSTDNTRELVGEFRHSNPRVRYIFEAKQGLSNARNAGIDAAKGLILAFVDDDVIVDAHWLANLRPRLEGPQWAGCGGRIRAQQELQLPKWVRLEGPFSMGGSLAALFDRGDEARELREPPYGANMAFRKSMFEKHGKFRADLGRSGSGMIGKEDIEFGERLLTAGEHLWYEPSAVVYHPVLEERLTKKYFLSWWFGCGQSTARLRGYLPGKWGLPQYFLSAGMISVAAARWLTAADPVKRFFLKCSTWMYAGKTLENYRQSQEQKRHNLQSVTNA